MKEQRQHIILSLMFLAIIGIPAIQTITRAFPENRLNGVESDHRLPKPDWADWYHFRYQPELNKAVEQKFGFRTFFVRLYNQIEYTFFRQPHGSGVVLGKQGYLYEEWFISSYYGKNYIGDQAIRFKIRQLRQIRHYLRQNGKELAVIVAPGKADYYPEYIPDRLRDTLRPTNYRMMTEALREAGIPMLDFNRLFPLMKDTVACPLFPKTGTHWSQYGARLAADSLSGFISSLIQRPLPDFRLGPLVPSDTLGYPDNDLEHLMNLFFPLSNDPLCYPALITQEPWGFNLPSAVVIGDSFFWQMFNLPLTDRIFSNVSYWYYNSTVYPESYTDSLRTGDLQLPEAFRNTDIILLMANPANIHETGWGFLERGVAELTDPAWQAEYDKMVREYIQAIHNTPSWEKQIGEDALKEGVPKDSLMQRNARYMVEQYLLTNELF